MNGFLVCVREGDMFYEKFSFLLLDYELIGMYIVFGMVGLVDFFGGRVVGYCENGL